MSDSTIADSLLRCPIDPARESPLTRADSTYTCPCHCSFPIRNSIPILLPTEAQLPENCPATNRLPCRLRAKKAAARLERNTD